MTHTPGPWETGSDKHGDEYRLCIVQNKSWRGQQFIARVEPHGVYEGLDEAEANARLIAAAPALLEALEELAELLEGQNRDSPQSMRMSIPGLAKRARSAIAQAKGE